MSSQIIALDPGGTTGVAFASDYQLIDAWQITQSLHHTVLHTMLSNMEPDLVVCESFQYRRMDKVDLIPVEYIGVARLWCSQNAVPFVLQTPTVGKKFWTDDKLKLVGEYKKGAPHANDAVRHLLQYLSFTAKDDRYIQLLRL